MIAEFTDGTSRSIFAMESNAKIPWTKPEDFEFEVILKEGKVNDEAVSQLWFSDDISLGVAFADGSADFIDRGKLDTPEHLKTLIDLFLINDGAGSVRDSLIIKLNSLP